jgi:hypothetical protein
MTAVPDGIVLKRHRDLEGRRGEIWVRRGLLALVGVVPLLALLNLFGQQPNLSTVAGPSASLEVYAPGQVRGGLLWQARLTVIAHRELKDAILELDEGWLNGMTINQIAPSPVREGSHDGKIVLELGHIPRGQRYSVFIPFQVNPTNVDRRNQDVRLYDGSQLIATLHRRLTVFP